MNKLFRLIISTVLLVLLCSLCCAAFATSIERLICYTSGKFVFIWNAPYNETEDSYDFTQAYNLGDELPLSWSVYRNVSDVVSSNPQVVKTKLLKDGGFIFWPKKPGRAQVSYVSDGWNYILDVVVNKYSNPCKSFKIGETDYSAQFNKVDAAHKNLGEKTKKLNAKIAVKPAKGWKLEDIRLGKKTHLKNGQKINLKFNRKLHEYTISATFRKEGTNYGCTLQLTLNNY